MSTLNLDVPPLAVARIVRIAKEHVPDTEGMCWECHDESPCETASIVAEVLRSRRRP